ncbi:hypothetical protein [Priestia megaterium]|uniref:hypothetical protein n=1 Tax=Priestia megaterium TaxID=1404 RepID=UPI00211BFA3C|nr:hypothetical protein [Priestia megaterium]
MIKNAIHLKNKVSIMIPSTKNAIEKIDNEKYVNESIILFSELFGGVTVLNCQGGYISSKYGLIKENVKNVFSYCEELTPENIASILEFIERLKVELKQECIALEINNNMYLV